MKRIYEDLLRDHLGMFPCVAMVGARQCGKTTLLHTLGSKWRYFDLERADDLEVIQHDPDLFFRLNGDRVAIDEAQLLPSLFPALRVAIDADRGRKGRFVLTGSSSPDLARSLSESLAGRLAVMEMSPLMWAETQGHGISPVINGLAEGVTDPRVLVEHGAPRSSLQTAHHYWFQGGYPEPWLSADPLFQERWADQYTQAYLDRDIARLFPALDRTRFRMFLRMLGGLSGDILNFAEIARALGVSQPTARDYIEIAHGTFVWRRLPAYHRSTLKRTVKHPKGYVRDTGLLHKLLRLPDLDALLAHPRAGFSWEGMVIEEILRQFHALGIAVESSFYRTGGGAEVDLICEGRFGVVPFEIKRGQRVDMRDLRGLRDFVAEQSLPIGVVINNDTAPRRYDERLVGIPFAAL